MDINKIMSQLTIEQKIGQLFLVASSGTSLSEGDRAHFLKYKIGNFICFSYNLTDYNSIRRLTDSLQDVAMESSGIPAFISADQENGMATRVYSGATHFPSNMAITASGMIDSTYQLGEMVGKELRALGINLNHAPVMDVNNNPDNPIIGIRSYSDDPGIVSKMGVSYIQGLQKSGVMANAKHFPGHGDTSMDSHTHLPCIDHDMNRLRAIELAPFKAAVAGGVDSIMTVHIKFNAMESEVPATLSHKILTQFLRGQIGFDGLIVSDCMTMNAIKEYFTTEKGCVMAINAGVDLLCICGLMEIQARCYDAVLAAVKSGEISMERLDEAVERILKCKKKYNLHQPAGQPQEKYPAHEAIAQEISEKSITLVKDDKNLLPLSGKKFLIISPPPVSTSIADDAMKNLEPFCKIAHKTFSDCKYVEIGINPDENEIDEVVKQAEEYEVILYGAYNASANRGQVQLFNALKSAGKQVVLVSLHIPYDILKMPDADCYIAAYEYTARAVGNVIKVIDGKLVPVGKLPVKI